MADCGRSRTTASSARSIRSRRRRPGSFGAGSPMTMSISPSTRVCTAGSAKPSTRSPTSSTRTVGTTARVRCRSHSNADAIQRLDEENYFFRISKYEQKLKDLYRDNRISASRDQAMSPRMARSRNCVTSACPAATSPGGSRSPTSPATPFMSGSMPYQYVTGVGFGTTRRKIQAAVAVRRARDRQGHHALPLHLLAGDAHGRRRGTAATGLRARLSRIRGPWPPLALERQHIDPITAANEWGSDALRYLLLREAPFARDSPISPELLRSPLQRGSANGWAISSRAPRRWVELYCDSRVPPAGRAGLSEQRCARRPRKRWPRMTFPRRAWTFRGARRDLQRGHEEANKHFQRTQPWQAV